MIATGPDLILSHVRHIDTVLLHLLGKSCDKCCRIHIIGIGGSLLLHGRTIFIQCSEPFLVVTVKFFFLKILEDVFCITYQWNGRTRIFADLRRIHVNVHQHFVSCDEIRLTDRAICHSGSHHDQQIRFVHGTVGISLTVIAHHSIIKRMFGRHNTDTHHGGHHGNTVFFRKAAQLLLGLTEQDSSSGTDNGTFRPLQLFDNLLDLHGMSFDGRLVGT